MKKRNMFKKESRVIARGEVSGHSHIITGDCEIFDNNNEIFIKTKNKCVIKHLLEQPFVNNGQEVWTKEHNDIELMPNKTYKYIQQVEYNPYEDVINQVKD